MPPCGKGNLHKVAAPYFFSVIYIVQLYKEDLGNLAVCWAVGPALQSNSSNCLVLIPHRQLGNCNLFSSNIVAKDKK